MVGLIGKSMGRYHILEQLGEGGMATVYKAYDTRLETDVAVKVIRTEDLPQSGVERALKRFEREAKSLAKLTHPNIVKVTDYGEYEGKPYLVMVYLPGGTLKELMGRPMAWQDAVRLLLPVAYALDYAHEHKVIHRDVKPSNILLAEKGQPMLTDFGIAKILETEKGQTLTGTGVGIGTPEYMAPEQGMGQEVDSRADVYSLGIVFYELVTGRKPYEADTPMAVVFKHLTDPLPSPSRFNPGLPDGVEKVIIKALAKKPEDRFENMATFAEALERLPVRQGIPHADEPKPAIRVTDPKVTLDEIAVDIPTQSLPPALSHEAKQDREIQVVSMPHQAPLGNRFGGFLKYWPVAAVMGCLALLVVFLAWLLPKVAAQVLPTPTQTATLTASPAPVNTATPPPSSTPQPRRTSAPSQTPSPTEIPTMTREKDGMLMVYVPQGVFTMGSDKGNSDERPAHSVSLDAFRIDRTNVTNALYAQCVQAGVCKPPFRSSSSTRSSYYGNSQFDDYPVIYVDWNQAKVYCEWAGARLPSEAEWEKAARGTDARTYPWGEGLDESRANYKGTDTTKVGSYPAGASPYGALDMAGNVWQWVADWNGETYYQNSPSNNPAGPSSGTNRVLRGGAWVSNEDSLRSADRNMYDPSITRDYVGFRCARSQ